MYFGRAILHECRPLLRALDGHHSRLLTRSNWPYLTVSATKSEGTTSPFQQLWSWNNYGWNGKFYGEKSMPLDLRDTGDAFSVEADLPGVKKENLNVRIAENGRCLVIEAIIGEKSDKQKAQSSEGDSTEADHSLLSERTAEFFRKVWLPQRVESSAVKAKLEDGVLKLHIPKAKEDGSLRIDVA